MEVKQRTAKTGAQIAAEIAALKALKPKLPKYSHFGDDNHDAVDAQIVVLTERLTKDQVKARFPHNGMDKLFMALIACDWMHGDLVGADDTPPSQDWPVAEMSRAFDFHAHLVRQRTFSEKTFGPGPRTAGVLDHIRKELIEIEAAPADLSEWIDVVILALDGAWRAGHSPDQIIGALVVKQDRNEARVWPDWRTAPTDRAIEHDRSRDHG